MYLLFKLFLFLYILMELSLRCGIGRGIIQRMVPKWLTSIGSWKQPGRKQLFCMDSHVYYVSIELYKFCKQLKLTYRHDGETK